MEDMIHGGYGGGSLNETKAVGPISMKQRLTDAVRQAEAKLADAKRAKEILDQHPELEELLNILNRGRF